MKKKIILYKLIYNTHCDGFLIITNEIFEILSQNRYYKPLHDYEN